jgi:hypothetical protein
MVMSSSPLERVQQDLDVIKSAMPSDFPYDRGSLAQCALAAMCGVPLALRAVPGWDGAMLVVLLALIAALMLVSGRWWRRAYTERGIRPRRWSWGRQEAVSGGVAVVGLIVYALLTRWLATADEGWSFAAWRGRLAAPALFAFGIGMLALGVAGSERRIYLGWGLALTALGLAMPWIPSRPTFWGTAGVAMALGGLASTVILWRQLRQWEDLHGRD